MVKHFGKYILLGLFFIAALILFMPKSSFYFLAEKEMQKFGFVISNEKLEENFLTLNIRDLDITLKGVQSAKVESVDMTFLLLYNSIEAKNIELSSIVDSFMPTEIKHLRLFYTPFSLFTLKGEAEGEFGRAVVEVDISRRSVKLFLKPSKIMMRQYGRSLRYFKRNKQGEYIYEKAL